MNLADTCTLAATGASLTTAAIVAVVLVLGGATLLLAQRRSVGGPTRGGAFAIGGALAVGLVVVGTLSAPPAAADEKCGPTAAATQPAPSAAPAPTPSVVPTPTATPSTPPPAGPPATPAPTATATPTPTDPPPPAECVPTDTGLAALAPMVDAGWTYESVTDVETGEVTVIESFVTAVFDYEQKAALESLLGQGASATLTQTGPYGYTDLVWVDESGATVTDPSLPTEATVEQTLSATDATYADLDLAPPSEDGTPGEPNLTASLHLATVTGAKEFPLRFALEQAHPGFHVRSSTLVIPGSELTLTVTNDCGTVESRTMTTPPVTFPPPTEGEAPGFAPAFAPARQDPALP